MPVINEWYIKSTEQRWQVRILYSVRITFKILRQKGNILYTKTERMHHWQIYTKGTYKKYSSVIPD